MPKITIDNKEIECRAGVPVLQAALEAGWDVPHYCYHPGLSIVASCRLCLMEMMMPNPKTQELSWSPKLVPSCQTPVKDGLICRFGSDTVKHNQRVCMEFFLLNHPLDCPVCDQAGECYLQDYSYKFGNPTSRMVDQKLKNPKKDIGPRTLLYQDRCVMCSRCVRVTDEVSGTFELGIVNRGSRCEIDAFPGKPLDNPLQGNVVDVCPVGAMLDKDFLFKRRVWELRSTSSVCPKCATGCAIHVDHADNKVYRLKPRFNPKVNTWWMCDEGRFGFKYVHDKKRIVKPIVRRGMDHESPDWADVPDIVRFRFSELVKRDGAAKVAAVLSPFLSCEEAWLLCKFIRSLAPTAALVTGLIPYSGEDRKFPIGSNNGTTKFTILKEKCPNRRGIETILKAFGGTTLTFDEFCKKATTGEFSAAWITGGYPEPWVEKETAKIAEKIEFLVVQDIFENELCTGAGMIFPSCGWAEREGSFMNAAGVLQSFERAIAPPDGAKQDGQYLYDIAGYSGLYRATRIRELMSAEVPAMKELYVPPEMPAHAH
ncbi:MAG: (2Fe-2S)-binding protein [Planctomycetes bacterium]|nr:(2Fe-2S)-binding protein [Planctomycetota bacterium]